MTYRGARLDLTATASSTAPRRRPFRTGADDHLWNALEKLAVLDPETFVDDFANACR